MKKIYKKNKAKSFILAMALLLLGGEALAQNIWYVKTNGDDTNSGNSWNTAYATIKKALTSANSGDKIYVWQGTYDLLYTVPDGSGGTNVVRSNFTMKNDVEIYGSFSNETQTPAQRALTTPTTVLTRTGAISSTESMVHNSTALNNSAVLDGFVLENWYTGSNSAGGAISNTNASPTLRNLVIRNNSAQQGGGIFNASNSSPVITNVVIIDHDISTFSRGYGAGIYNADSSPTLTNVTISGNKGNYGGGMINLGNSSPVLTNVLITGNSVAYSSGAAIYNGNTSIPTLTNVTISGNKSASGGVVYNRSDASSIIRNSIIFGNSGGMEESSTVPSTIDYSWIQGNNGSTGTGNQNGNIGVADDVFVAPEKSASAPTTAGNYKLLENEFNLAIDGGNSGYFAEGQTPDLSDITTDLAGVTRFYNTVVDMGAYESELALPLELLSFSGKTVSNGHLLEWKTADERSFNGFELQRSADDGHFNKIAFIKAKGNGNYSFTDSRPQQGNNYYRLKMLDNDSTFELSENVVVLNFALANAELNVYPIPMKNVLNVANAKGQLRIINTQGQLVRKVTLAENDVTAIDVTALPTGLYLLQLQQKDGKIVNKKALKASN